ncbi:MAG: MBL fold metallo-hydrolase [Deltaproteobacteria bacterium]|nr:MBL fold metallo-hydrolase [Deltaproteobacteria bacterium]
MELTPNLHAYLWNSPAANNCNTYLIRSGEKNILIDPGHAAHFDHVRRGLREAGLSLDAIDLVICTHAHPDHVEAVSLFGGSTLFALHAEEWQLVRKMAAYLKSAVPIDPEQFMPDFFLKEGVLEVGDIALQVVHAPGHSPGSIAVYWPQEKALFSGDVIFKNGLGRTDLPGGNGSLLKESIRGLSTLDAGWLLSGHGDVVSGAEAVRANFEQVERMWFGYI